MPYLNPIADGTYTTTTDMLNINRFASMARGVGLRLGDGSSDGHLTPPGFLKVSAKYLAF